MDRTIKYIRLSELRPNPENPKDHDISLLVESIERFGFNDAVIVDGRTGLLVGGHGRVEALRWMEENNRTMPEGLLVHHQSMGPESEWHVPAQTGWSSKDDAEAMAFIVAANRTTELGGWNQSLLDEVLLSLGKLGEEALVGTGYDEDDILRLLNEAQTPALSQDYTSRIIGPVYAPKGDQPKITALVDDTRAAVLEAEIEKAADLSDAERRFLKQASRRHLKFDYQAIAEFYAHASAPMQRAMEASALVVIDFKQAMERGFIELTESIMEEFEDEADS